MTSPRVTKDVADRLMAAGCIAAEEEAQELIAVSSDESVLELLIGRRERGEPLAWITGATRFCGHSVRVDPGVYVPRWQTEELARRAAALLAAGGAPARAVDLCTGSGAIAVHLKRTVPSASVVAVDSDVRAVICARRNGVAAIRGDLDRPLCPGRFDIVTAVAPYVPTPDLAFLPADVVRYEPRRALDGGHDGLDVLRRVVAAAARLLRLGGWLLAEAGGDQDRGLATNFGASGFGAVATWSDADGELRGLATQLVDRRR
jgi:release factor glutamine methyltransferase